MKSLKFIVNICACFQNFRDALLKILSPDRYIAHALSQLLTFFQWGIIVCVLFMIFNLQFVTYETKQSALVAVEYDMEKTTEKIQRRSIKYDSSCVKFF